MITLTNTINPNLKCRVYRLCKQKITLFFYLTKNKSDYKIKVRLIVEQENDIIRHKFNMRNGGKKDGICI